MWMLSMLQWKKNSGSFTSSDSAAVNTIDELLEVIEAREINPEKEISAEIGHIYKTQNSNTKLTGFYSSYLLDCRTE